MCKMSAWLLAVDDAISMLKWCAIKNGVSSEVLLWELSKVQSLEMALEIYALRFEHFSWIKRSINAIFNFNSI